MIVTNSGLFSISYLTIASWFTSSGFHVSLFVVYFIRHLNLLVFAARADMKDPSTTCKAGIGQPES